MTDLPAPDFAVDRIRAFNRFYTRRIGILSETLLGSRFSLTEARILFEIAVQPGILAKSIGAALDLDAGYLSRILAKFARDGLVSATRLEGDGRQKGLRLTEAGETASAELQGLSRVAVGSMLSALTEPDRDALVAATGDIMARLGAPPSSPIELRPHRPGDLGWIVERHAVHYARDYGFDSRFEAMVAEIAAAFLRNFDPAREFCAIAERDGRRLGSVMVVRSDEETAKLRLLLVEPEARGTGLGRRLVQESIDFARAAGYRQMMLWTNDVLVAARRLYETAGFRLADTAEHDEFGPRMNGETWVRTL
jgi:DNA-binding MarR family transcriptional regulator/GNAT superfamily N-acetyltransferase